MIYNNKYYFKFIDTSLQIFFLVIGITNNTWHYYINSILKNLNDIKLLNYMNVAEIIALN